MQDQAKHPGLGETLPELTELKEAGYYTQAKYELMCGDGSQDPETIKAAQQAVTTDQQTIKDQQTTIRKLKRQLQKVKEANLPTTEQPTQQQTPEPQPQPTGTITGTWATLNIYLIQNNYTKQTDETYKNQAGQHTKLEKIKEGNPPIRDNQSLIKQDLISPATPDTYQLTRLNN
jgi:hypothetical protein